MKATPRRARSARAILLLGFVGLALSVTAACGPEKESSGSASPTPSGSASASPSSPSPSPSSTKPPIGTPQTSPPGATQALETHQGTVQRGAEPSCLILHASDGNFELEGGSSSVIRPGATIKVSGYREQGMMSHCMQGTMFKVVSAQAVS